MDAVRARDSFMPQNIVKQQYMKKLYVLLVYVGQRSDYFLVFFLYKARANTSGTGYNTFVETNKTCSDKV